MKHTFCHHLQITIQDRLQWGIVRKLQTRRAISETNKCTCVYPQVDGNTQNRRDN